MWTDVGFKGPGTLEQSLGRLQNVTVTYLGAAGRRLLRRESLLNVNPNFTGNSSISNSCPAGSDSSSFQGQRVRLVE